MLVLPAPSFGHGDCERIVGGALAQPVLAVTSLAYVAAGAIVLSGALRNKAPLAGTAGAALVGVGAGSFAFHGPQPAWAGTAHDVPIFALAAVFAAGLGRSRRLRSWSGWARPCGIFVVGLGAWAAGRSDSPLCRPDSLWQFHGAWHVISAVALGLAARHALGSRPVSAVQRR